MLFSFSLIIIFGLIMGTVFEKLGLTKIMGMLLAGILLGPYVLNLIDEQTMAVSADLRTLALIIILARAGLNLDIEQLKKVGRPAVLMCFVPACFEIIGITIFAPIFLGVSTLEALIIGTVVAAVSPAVVVPRMIKLIDEGYGTDKSIPQMVMAGASVDDVFVIVLFTAFTSLASGENISALNFVSIPTSIIFGVMAGVLVGLALIWLFKKIKLRDSLKVIIMFAVFGILVTIEHNMTGIIGFSGILAVMVSGITIMKKDSKLANRISLKFSKLWIIAEILLFVLVGISVNVDYALKAGAFAVLLVACAMLFRMVGVVCCLFKTKLNKKERVFTAFAYMPKATVQAAIGSIPLAMGLSCGDTVLTVAVVAILLTAPLGAGLIDFFYKKLLFKNR